MDIWIGLAVGIFAGAVISLMVFLAIIGGWYIGNLREDRSSGDDKPYYFMEVSKGAMGKVSKNAYVVLRVKRENYVQ